MTKTPKTDKTLEAENIIEKFISDIKAAVEAGIKSSEQKKAYKGLNSIGPVKDGFYIWDVDLTTFEQAYLDGGQIVEVHKFEAVFQCRTEKQAQSLREYVDSVSHLDCVFYRGNSIIDLWS